jgi:hypothetical protein
LREFAQFVVLTRVAAQEAAPPVAASYEQVVAAAEALRTSSGDSAAYASCHMKILKAGILLLLLASAAVGAGLAYKSGADMRQDFCDVC